MAHLNFPLPQHAQAMPAANAAMCAGAQGKFWQYQSALFEQQTSWAGDGDQRAAFERIGQRVGADVTALRACMQSNAMRPAHRVGPRPVRARRRVQHATFIIGNERLSGAAPIADFRACSTRRSRARRSSALHPCSAPPTAPEGCSRAARRSSPRPVRASWRERSAPAAESVRATRAGPAATAIRRGRCSGCTPHRGRGAAGAPVLELARRERPTCSWRTRTSRRAPSRSPRRSTWTSPTTCRSTRPATRPPRSRAAPHGARVQQARRVAAARARRRPRGRAHRLVSATLGAGSSRRGRLATAALASSYAQLDAVGAISAEDAERLQGSACARTASRHGRHALRPGLASRAGGGPRERAARAARRAGPLHDGRGVDLARRRGDPARRVARDPPAAAARAARPRPARAHAGAPRADRAVGVARAGGERAPRRPARDEPSAVRGRPTW
jgi:hypothetical protein